MIAPFVIPLSHGRHAQVNLLLPGRSFDSSGTNSADGSSGTNIALVAQFNY